MKRGKRRRRGNPLLRPVVQCSSSVPGAGPGESGIVPDPYTRWCGIENISRITVDGERVWALLDTRCQINTITPRLVEALGLEVLPIADLVGDQQDCIIGVEGSAVQPKGYVIINLQVDAANKYNEDAIAVVIPDASKFASRVPMILGTCTLGRVVEAMKESELESLTPQWDMVWYARELVVKTGRVEWKIAGSQCKKATVEGADEVLTAWRGELLEPYATYQIMAKIKARATGAGQYVLIHTLPHGESKLLIGVEVRDTYTRVQQGKGTISVVVQNMTPNKENKVLTLTRPERVQKLMEDLDLQGLDSCDGEVRRQSYELFEEYKRHIRLGAGRDWML